MEKRERGSFNSTESEHASGSECSIHQLQIERDAALQAAQDAVFNTTRLTRLLTILSEPAPLTQLLDRLLSLLSELFSADIVILLDPVGTGSFSPLAAIGLPDEMADEQISNIKGSYVAEVLQTVTPSLTDTAESDPNVDYFLKILEVKTIVWIPVTDSHESARGVLILARCCENPFSYSDVDLLTAMGYRIGLTLEQAQRTHQMEQFIESTHAISRHLDESIVITEAIRMFCSIIKANGTIFMIKRNDNCSECISQCGIQADQCQMFDAITEALLTYSEFSATNPYTTPDIHEDAVALSLVLPKDFPVHSLIAIPVFRNRQIYGLLYGIRFSALPFSAETLQVATIFAGQISSTLENARLYRSVQEELIERRRAESALRSSDERFRALISSVSDVIAIVNVDGTIRYSNPAVESAWKCTVEDLYGTNILDRLHPDDKSIMRELLVSLKPTPTTGQPLRIRQGENSWRDCEVILINLLTEQAISGIVITFHDVTERKSFEKKLTRLAYHDPLTGLSNRSYFKEKLQIALEEASKNEQSVAVFFFDLDNFKLINDSMGHESGDRVLQTVADRLRKSLRHFDIAARMGGDEFTLYLENITSIDQVIPVAHRIIDSFRTPLKFDDRDFFISISMGIAVSVPYQDNIDDLLRKADLAMYHAKNNDKGSYAIFDTHLNAAALERMELETELRRALINREFTVYYQVIVTLGDRLICDVEALVRWQHPRLGLVPPVKFIPIAEETGLIMELGQWVLEEACRQVSIWQRVFSENLSLSVNLSARQFRNVSLVGDITEALHNTGLRPRNLTLEITETDLIYDPIATIAKLQALKKLGIQLAIDDFGIGYSSLSYLKKFPVDILKIDKTFIEGIEYDQHDKAITRSVIALAEAFDLKVIGEGIETEEQLAQLIAMGCNYGQGYLFSKPLSVSQFENFLHDNPGMLP